MAPMLAWVGIVLGAVYLVDIGGAWWGIYSSPLRVASVSIAAAALGLWGLVAWRKPAWRPRSVLLPVIAAGLASFGVSTLFSRVPRVSLEYLGYAILLAALYLLLVRIVAAPFFRRRLAVLATLLLVVIVVAFLVRVGARWVEWWTVLGRLSLPPLRPGFEGLTYNNPSAVLTMVALLAVPAIATFGSSSRRGILTGGAILLALGVVAVISGSRAGWLALALAGAIAAIVWLADPGRRGVLRRAVTAAVSGPGGRIAVVVAALAIAGIVIGLGPAIIRRAAEGGENLRLAYAAAALRMFAESPLVGTGPGTWVIQRMRYTLPTEQDYYIPHAHNIEAQTLAELGIVGALAGVLALAAVAWLLRDGARDTDPGRRRWAWATGIGLLYFALHQQLDFYMNMPAFLFAAALPVAYLDATATRQPWSAWRWTTRLQTAVSPRVGVAGIVAIGIATAGLLWQEVPAARQAAAVAAANDRYWGIADGPARDAAAMDPDIGSYQLTAGLTAARAGDHLAAAGYFERIARRDDLPEAWLNLAAEQAQLGRKDEALASIGAALRLGYQRPAVSMPAGDLALRLGATDLATNAFAAAVARTPSLAGDPWWHRDPARADIFDVVIAQAVATTPVSDRWQVALMAGDVDLAKTLANDAGGETASARAIIAAWTGDAAAIAAILERCEGSTRDLGLTFWCGRIEGHIGNIDAAKAYRVLANIAVLGTYPAAGELRVSESGMDGRQMLGDPADLWATYTYRRPAPWDILVPSLIHLTLE